MLCDDCIKKEVCKYMEKCKAYEEEYTTPKTEVITLEVKCKHRDARATIRKPLTLDSFMGVNAPRKGGDVND